MKEKSKSNGLERYVRWVDIKFKSGKHLKLDRRRRSYPIGKPLPEMSASEKLLWESHYPLEECEARWAYKKLS